MCVHSSLAITKLFSWQKYMNIVLILLFFQFMDFDFHFQCYKIIMLFCEEKKNLVLIFVWWESAYFFKCHTESFLSQPFIAFLQISCHPGQNILHTLFIWWIIFKINFTPQIYFYWILFLYLFPLFRKLLGFFTSLLESVTKTLFLHDIAPQGKLFHRDLSQVHLLLWCNCDCHLLILFSFNDLLI